MYKLVEYSISKEFKFKYNCNKTPYYQLYFNDKLLSEELYILDFFNTKEKLENLLNSKRYISLLQQCVKTYSDHIMETCHGKDWKTKNVSPNYLDTIITIFDTNTKEFIYKTNSYTSTYASIYENLLIVDDNKTHKTIVFDLSNRNLLLEGRFETIETNNHILIYDYYKSQKMMHM